MNRPPIHGRRIDFTLYRELSHYWLFASFIMLCMMFSSCCVIWQRHFTPIWKFTHNQKCYFVYVRFDKAQPLKHWYAPDHFRWKCLHECSPLLTEFSSAAVKLTAKLVIIEKIQGCSSVRFQTALLSHLLQQMILSAVPQDGSLR